MCKWQSNCPSWLFTEVWLLRSFLFSRELLVPVLAAGQLLPAQAAVPIGSQDGLRSLSQPGTPVGPSSPSPCLMLIPFNDI